MSMDKLFRSDFEWFISPVIDLSNFLEKCQDVNDAFSVVTMPANSDFSCTGDSENEMATNEMVAQLASLTGCSAQTAQTIFRKDLNIDALRGTDGRTMHDDDATVLEHAMKMEEVPEDCSLETVKAARERAVQSADYSRKSHYLKEGKYFRYKYAVPLKRGFTNSIRAQVDKDFVITCSLPAPNNKLLGPEDPGRAKALKPAIKLLVRGDTSLLDFRRRLACPCDMSVDMEPGKWFEAPDIQNKSHMLLYPSSFIFIHDTFYVDLDSKGTHDTSLEVRQFMERDPKTYGHCKVKSIDNVKFRDIKLRLGQPYLMMHCGDCEHLLIFHDLRTLTHSDEQDASKYPLVAFEKAGDNYCMGCKRVLASMVVENCDLLPKSPSFLCRDCFKEFLFNSNNEPVVPFNANFYYPLTKLTI
ncbi:unnamed protein product, partial [Mesorhabditis spiculigera]